MTRRFGLALVVVILKAPRCRLIAINIFQLGRLTTLRAREPRSDREVHAVRRQHCPDSLTPLRTRTLRAPDPVVHRGRRYSEDARKVGLGHRPVLVCRVDSPAEEACPLGQFHQHHRWIEIAKRHRLVKGEVASPTSFSPTLERP